MMYNDIIQQVGKRILKHIYYVYNGTTTYVNDDNLQRIKLIKKSELLRTAIQGAEIIVQEELKGSIYIEIEAKYQEYTQTKTFGPYYVKEKPKYDANKLTYTYIVYDGFVKSMVDYEPLEVTYPITINNYFFALLNKLGYTTDIVSLPNGSRTMASDIYTNIGYTYRDVLDDIAVANGVLFKIDNNVVKIVQLGTNTININDDILKNSNIDFGEHFGPINSIVLSRGGESDNVYIKDDESIALNGLHEFKIVDNQLMRENDRDEYLNVLSTQLFGIEYDIYDTELVGYGNVGFLDEVVFTTKDKTYNSYIFNDEIILTSGYKQTIYNDMPKESETDYKSADTTDKRINQAYIITRKNEAEIEALSRKVVDVSNTINGNGSVTLENAHEGILHYLSIYGSMSLLFPSDNLYPSSTLYPLSSILMVDDVEYDIGLKYLRYLSPTIYDEFIYEDGKCKVIRRVGDNNGTLYELPEEVEEPLDDIFIEVKSNSVIKMKSFNNLIYSVTYLLENEYTDTFTNQVELTASINILGDEIESKVSKNDVVSTINQSAEEIKITGNRFVVEANNFKLDKYGDIMSKSGTIGNWVIGNNMLYCNIQPNYDYTQEDVTRIQGIITESITPTTEDYEKYDINKDGAINAQDLLQVSKCVQFNIGYSNPGKLLLDTTDWFRPIKIINGNGSVVAWFGITGSNTQN